MSARGRALLILCHGGHQHVMNEVQIVPVDVVRRWQASLLNRLPGPDDAVPRLYACATCFGRETADADYLKALGLPEAATRLRRVGARLAGLYDRRR